MRFRTETVAQRNLRKRVLVRGLPLEKSHENRCRSQSFVSKRVALQLFAGSVQVSGGDQLVSDAGGDSSPVIRQKETRGDQLVSDAGGDSGDGSTIVASGDQLVSDAGSDFYPYIHCENLSSGDQLVSDAGGDIPATDFTFQQAAISSLAMRVVTGSASCVSLCRAAISSLAMRVVTSSAWNGPL